SKGGTMPVPVPTSRGLWYTYRLWSDLFKGTWPEVQKRIQFYLSKYFYKDDLLKAFLFDRDFAELPKNRFIDYARYLNYYASDIKETTLKMGEASKRARLPYREVINFVEKPNVKIDVVGNITEYVMSQQFAIARRFDSTELNRSVSGRLLRQKWGTVFFHEIP